MQNEYLQPLWDAFGEFADYPAIVDRGATRTTSYREFREIVCRVVAWICDKELAGPSFIPIVLPQSMEYVAAETGIWMAGHSSVPMGPAFPPERIAYIRDHCDAPFVIDEDAWAEIAATEPASFADGQPDLPDPELPALLIYTSGSTGAPKGILHTFADLSVKHTAKVGLRYSTDDNWGMGAPLYFVASLTVFKVLKEGATLHLYDADTYHDMRKLEDYIVEQGITYTFLSPSMLANFHNRSDKLKLVFTGSERLSNQCSRDGYKLMNCYGMSETAGTVCGFLVQQRYDTTPVGKPEEEWCLLGDDGRPVAEGEEGEFCLSGHYCAGYYKDPERTAELYRDGWLHTGDILRQLPDGNLVYVNRKDWMAKINGQRVEPGEVENAIAKFPGVDAAVVKAFDNESGSQYLCAFFTGEAEPDDIRADLSAKLPPYMVPAHFVPVREFALLPNGKVNRKILAAPDVSKLQSGYVAPENAMQAGLCDAFAELFGLEQVGIDDDFFLLGGDSIRVMKLQQLCADLPLSAQAISEGRTPRKIAAAIAAETAASDVPDAAAAFGSTPLTQTQLGIYVESMARVGEAAYNNPVLLRLDARLDAERLARALEAAIEAHPFVKIHIEEDAEGTPLMVPGEDAYRQEVEQMDDAAFERVKATLIEPFDLHAGPLFRMRVIRTQGGLYLFTDFHHIIYDGTSMRVFMADVDAAYAGAALQPETFTGFDVAAREARLRDGDAYQMAREWCESEFADLDVESAPLPDCTGAEVAFASADYALGVAPAQVERFCGRLGITPNVLAIAAFGKLLGAYANMDESLFATIYNGRNDVRTARTVDMMVKTLPVHCRWDADTRVSEYVAEVKRQVLGAMANDLCSFAEISAMCGVSSDVLFAYQGDYLALGTVCGLPFERVDLGGNATGSALDFQLFRNDDDFVMHAEYQCNRYSDRFVADMMRSYARVLAGLLLAERLSDVDIADSGQIAVLDGFNETEVPYDAGQTIVSLFRAAAKRHPGNVAVIYEDDQLSYRELDVLTDRLASYINSRGVGAGDVVSILIPRGLWMPVASLGALKAGCGYQPLDATYPPERLNFMVEDAGARMLITTAGLRPVITGFEGDVLVVDTPEGLPVPQAGVQIQSDPVPDSLFILLYTSGTTGLPKGVRLLHRNLVCFVNWYHRYYGLQAGDRVGAYASYGFDACMMDMYPALTCGAAVVIVPEEMRLDLAGMDAYYTRHQVTHAFMTTQVGRQFAMDATCPTLKHLSMGGETLVPFAVPEAFATYNVYGPTECTILTTVYPLKPGEEGVPIGTALDNVKAYVVGIDGKRVPVGAAGELWLAGPQVGAGYLNRPEKTAEVFVENPFDGGLYASAYRTGDIVRYRPDGAIDFIGRRDGQVKVRGFRIELSEVEAVVREFPGVKDATVAAFDHPSGGKYVAAYVVSDEPIDVDALGDFIRGRKPPYMVPAATVQLDRIPLNQNGKVNRRALPEPNLAGDAMGAEDEAPRTLNVLEQELHALAASVLGTDAFGVTTPLALCGMTSILRIKLLSLVYKRFGVQLRAQDVDDVSVERLENLVLGVWMAGGFAPAAQSQAGPAPSEFRAPLTFAQMGVYYECLKHPVDLAYNIPSMVTFGAGTTADAVDAAIRAVVAAHPTLGACFAKAGDGVELVPGSDVPEIVRVDLADDELAGYAREFVRPFDLEGGPLCRFAIAKTPERTCMLADFHHLAFDGASMGVFLKDLAVALRGGVVEPETYTYSDYANDERAFQDSDGFAENGEYIARLLADFETASELAADKPSAEGAGRQRIASCAFDLPAVEEVGRRLGVTAAAFMLAASSYAISRYTGERTVYLSTISNGRADVRTSDTIGMLVNTLPLAIDVADVPVSGYAASCSDALAAAIAHERYPFAQVAADHGFAPQIVYEYQVGAVDVAPDMPWARVESLAPDDAKFKLAVHIEPVEGKPSVAVYYDDMRYSRELAEGLARSIVIAADAMRATPQAPVRGIALLDGERRAQLERFHTVASGPLDYSLFHEGLERQARLNPQATALIAVDATFTYAELNAQANRLAHALVDRGVARNSRIALLLPRTSRAIIAMFGVMKAGCAYIPCDPSYPPERISHILEDSGAALVVSAEGIANPYPGAIDVEALLSHPAEGNLGLDISPRDLAYLIYTSGSTGKPKGVMLAHEGVCNYTANRPANSLVDALVRDAHAMVAVTTLSFDMSIKEWGICLMNGLTLVLADESQVNDPGALARLFRETGADSFSATHSRLKQYLEHPGFAAAIGRCTVVVSGAEKYVEGLLPLLKRTTDARIFNTYGPTEITVSSNMKELTHEDRISVGQPIYNTWECIVDSDGNEVPAGVVGELLIGGLGVAVGYNNLPDKTAEAFVDYRGRRVYRSGDYARWTASGDVEILGRTDNQIKLRGLRIEIGEVEGAIANLVGVKDVVVKIGEINGVEHLCAYFTAERPLDAVWIRNELGTTLARYMVPTAYLQLEAFPTTPNGKVDYRALPPAALLRASEAVAAANEVEQAFCNMFSEILGIEGVGATDSFFEIGGTSLMAIRVTVEAEKLGYQVAYADVFANPTPRMLAALCAGEHDQAAESASDADIEDFDYGPIDDLLAENNLRGFGEGSRRPLGNVLLTGAVGYLGIHILHEFLERYAGTAYCLLRGRGEMDAALRLKHQLFYYFERDYGELFGSRIVVIEGDVTKPLPVTPDMQIDMVVNCAAVVKHFSSGTEIEDVNVGGVRNLVEFCLQAQVPLVQISTASTMKCPLKPGASVVGKATERQLYIGQDLENKYTRSKFLGERLLLDAVARRGLAGKIMRVGNLAPRTSDGEFQINYGTNASMGRLKSYALLKCAPFDQLDATMEFSPIDEVARAILLLAQTPPDCTVFHPFNHHQLYMADVFQAMAVCGLEVAPVEREEFVRALKEAESDPDKARVLTSMLAYARKATVNPPVIPVAGNAYTMQVLYRLGFRWTATSIDYVERFLDALEGLGFFDWDE